MEPHDPAADAPRTVRPPAALLAGGLVAGWLGLVLAGGLLAAAVHATGRLPGDVGLAQEIQEPRAAALILGPLLRAASLPGNAPWVEALYGAAVALPLLRRRWAAAALVAATATGDALAGALKLLIGRTRPTADLVTIVWPAAGYSFPSGHVVHYVVFFGVLAYLAARALRAGSPRADRLRGALLRGVVVGAGLLIAVVGVSRVYLGAHWPSDVLGGYLLGGAWLALLLAVYRRCVRPRPRRAGDTPLGP